MAEAMRIVHPIPPLFDENSRVLILGSFPSVKSREARFFYGHPQNRFWKLMARLFSEEIPVTVGTDLLYRYSALKIQNSGRQTAPVDMRIRLYYQKQTAASGC